MKNRFAKASREQLEALATAADNQTDGCDNFSLHVNRALQALREACPPLRTRAEVDAEIVRVLRSSVAKGLDDDCLALHNDEYDYPDAGLLRELCAEETQDP